MSTDLVPSPAPGAAGDPGPGRRAAARSRRRSWLVLAAVALVTASYLVAWSTWATLHTADRFDQRAPGAAASRGGAGFRLVSLTQSTELTDQRGGDSQVAAPGAVLVVAVLEVVEERADARPSCSVDLLGPGGRLWTSDYPDVQRDLPSCWTSDLQPGRPYRFEAVFEVPERYADRLLGVALTDRSGPRPSAVLRPPA